MKRIRLGATLLGLCAALGMAQTTAELVNDGRNTDNVTTQSMGYDRKSYSPLHADQQIERQAAGAGLEHQPHERLGELAAPTIYNGVMYVVNGKWTFAIDVETGRQIWRTPVRLEPARARRVRLINRGARDDLQRQALSRDRSTTTCSRST